MSEGIALGTVCTHCASSSSCIAHCSGSVLPCTGSVRARSFRRVPWQSGHGDSLMNGSTRLRPFASFALSSALSTVRAALKYVKSISPARFCFFKWYMMCRFSAGPCSTISFSWAVRSLYGTSVRTPISRHTSTMTDHMSERHGATAPCSIVRFGSAISVESSTVRTIPVPEQVGHAPPELNARSSAPSACTSAPHTGQMIGRSSATFGVGSSMWPFGQV